MPRVSADRFSALMLLGFAALTAQAQSSPAPNAPESAPFEVATIKPVDMTSGMMHRVGIDVYPEGRVRITTFSLKGLICAAYNVNGWQLAGGDAWMEKERFDVEAKAPDGPTPVTYNLRHSNLGLEDERLRQMLQALLADRFHLKFHMETRTGPVDLLEKTGKSVPLTPSTESAAKMFGQGFSGDVGRAGNRWSIYNTSMPQLARAASTMLRMPVVDRTGLTGFYDFRWQMLPADETPQTVGFTDSFPLFLEAMGLKLTKSTGPTETLVIEYAERPSPN